MTHDKTTGLDPNVLGAAVVDKYQAALDAIKSTFPAGTVSFTVNGAQMKSDSGCTRFVPLDHLMQLSGHIDTIIAALQSKREEECVVWLSNDDAETVLFQAIQSIKFGNGTDDKMILKNLYEAGYWIANMPDKKDEKAS